MKTAQKVFPFGGRMKVSLLAVLEILGVQDNMPGKPNCLQTGPEEGGAPDEPEPRLPGRAICWDSMAISFLIWQALPQMC